MTTRFGLALLAILWPFGALGQQARTITGWNDDPVPVFQLEKGNFIEVGSYPAAELMARGDRVAREERGFAMLPGEPPLWVELGSLRLHPKIRAARDVCDTIGSPADQSLLASLGGRKCP